MERSSARRDVFTQRVTDKAKPYIIAEELIPNRGFFMIDIPVQRSLFIRFKKEKDE